jgi:endonuclease/exonuclease/phosphatase family metal-dependent hydrolase
MRIILILFFVIQTALASHYKVMTFNTMCSFCDKKTDLSYDDRLEAINKIVKNHRPDIIALQEVLTGSAIDHIFKDLKNYTHLYFKNGIITYADPSLSFNQEKFNLISNQHYWLGPKGGHFSLGWKFSLPRLIQKAVLEDKATKKRFSFYTTHFDNRNENKIGSIEVLKKMLQKEKLPFLFAADINLRVTDEYYKMFFSQFLNPLESGTPLNFVNEQENSKKCYAHKGSKFPKCVVDHILMDQNFEPINWTMDLTKVENDYPSDHRPIVVTLKFSASQE